MMFTKGEQCSERVSDGGRWPRYYQCTKKAVVERDAKHYCKIHDPEYIKAKRQAQCDKWDAERKKRHDGYKRESLAREIFQDIATDTIEANKEKYKSAPDMYKALKQIQKWLLENTEIEDGVAHLYNEQFIKANNLTVKALSEAEA